MVNSDDPVFNENLTVPPEESDLTLRDRIQQLTDEQEYAVLCVQGGGQPYGALVAFAFSEDLRHVVFATPNATRK